MPIASGFTRDPNPNYVSSHRPGRTEYLDEAIYYKNVVPVERPIERIPPKRPIIKETIFLPDRKAPPLVSTRDIQAIAPEPISTIYPSTGNVASKSSFNLFRALQLNADCPCWAWILIVFSIILLLALIGMCLYFILDRDEHR